MGRPHWHPPTCKVCGLGREDGVHVSQTGLCPDHSKQRFEANYDAMKTMSGPFARHWRERMAAAVGAVLLDEPTFSAHTGSDAR